jgi:hypothetical protein
MPILRYAAKALATRGSKKLAPLTHVKRLSVQMDLRRTISNQ